MGSAPEDVPVAVGMKLTIGGGCFDCVNSFVAIPVYFS